MQETSNASPFMQPYQPTPPWWTQSPPPYNPMGVPFMGTRGGGQQQPLSPGDFGFGNVPGGFQSQLPFQGMQQGTPGMQQQGFPGMQQGIPGAQQGIPGMQQQGIPGMQQQGVILSDADRAALRPVLAILKEVRTHLAGGQLTVLNSYRILAAYAYLAGFLEARGLLEVGAFPRTIPQPQPVTAGGHVGNEHYDRLISSLDSLVSGTETRIPPVVVAVGASVAGAAIWDGIKWAYGRVMS